MVDLTRMALRMDPDRVVVGEVRGAEAFPMLLAMSQGNNGSMCTMHADSARTVFPKLLAYVAMSASGLTGDTVNMLIGSAVHLVVHISMVENTRRVMSIHEVVDTDGISIVSNEVYSYNKRGNQFLSMRGSTAELLASHGFNPSREMSWS